MDSRLFEAGGRREAHIMRWTFLVSCDSLLKGRGLGKGGQSHFLGKGICHVQTVPLTWWYFFKSSVCATTENYKLAGGMCIRDL